MTANLLVLLGVFGGIGLVSLLPMYLVGAPKEWCRTCKHQSGDHAGGTGACHGDDFPVGEFIPSGTCGCAAYVPRRGPR
ncbi:hypothetical protein ACFYVL_20850 [Streptomyces sp. NPDC004111]|uniref:hypothetical protein n=1 Tax=Streptomyces sp. NPDC004111 TaxID=3364690 RepID=UPI003692D28D